MPNDYTQVLQPTTNVYLGGKGPGGTLVAGEEVSMNGETRKIISVLNSSLSFVDPGDVMVNKGQPVMLGLVPGKAIQSANTTASYVDVQTNGVHAFAVKGEDGSGNAALNYGAAVYYDTDGELNCDATNGKRFGTWLGANISSGATVTGPVMLGF